MKKLITKLPVLKCAILKEKKLEDTDVLHITENLTTGTFLQSIFGVTITSFSGKKRIFL